MRPTWPNLGRRCAPDSFASQANRQSQRQRRQRQRERDTETETETDRERDGERDNRDRRPNMVARFSHVVDAGVLAFERRGRGASGGEERDGGLVFSCNGSPREARAVSLLQFGGCCWDAPCMSQPPRKPLFWHALFVIVCLSVVYCVLMRNASHRQQKHDSAHHKTAGFHVHKTAGMPHVPAPAQTSALARFVCDCLSVCGLLRLGAECVAHSTKI